MIPKVHQIVEILERAAPSTLAEPWDNGGLLAGSMLDDVSGILVTLDITEDVVREAVTEGLSMIVSHHPILFDGIKTLNQSNPQGRLASLIAKSGIAVYSSHTALDLAPGGVCDSFAEKLGLSDIQAEGYLRIGNWDGGDCMSLLTHIRELLQSPTVRLYGNSRKAAKRVACLPGSGMDFAMDAVKHGADAFITGDVRHHDALDFVAYGMTILDAGHLPSERIAAERLFFCLQKAVNDIEYTIRIKMSVVCPFIG